MRQLKISPKITNRGESQSLDKYLNDISREELLTTDEEVELARRIRQGDSKALERLTRANLRFVVSVAKQYQGQGLALADLINEGNLGLIKAAQKFDETRGFKFISYAVWWIRQSIMTAIAEQGRPVRLPLNQVGQLGRVNRSAERFEQQHGRRPSADEIADYTQMSAEKVEEALAANTRQVSMDAPLKDGDSTSMIDLMAADSTPDTDAELLRQSLHQEIEMTLGCLDERCRNIICAYFGIGEPEQTMDEIGKRYGLSRERVRQIRTRAIRILRNNTNNKALKAYLGK